MRALLLLALVAGPSFAQTVSFRDPTGDDTGPGAYTYPTDAVYSKGTFDLRALTIAKKEANYEVTIELAALKLLTPPTKR